jgi:hypothetical protein
MELTEDAPEESALEDQDAHHPSHRETLAAAEEEVNGGWLEGDDIEES